jgi:predicted amidohydrolase
VNALLAQLTARVGDTTDNTARAREAILGHPDVDFAVFPELFLSGYTYERLEELALEPDSDEILSLRQAAASANTAVVVGFAERVGAGVANAAACIDQDGSLAAVYRKTQLFGQEQDVFLPGETLLLVELAGRTVAPLICFDIEFPEPARQLALAGAQLLITASANMEPFYVDHEVASKARAVENRLPHLYANAVGPGSGMTFVGGSRAVSPLGHVPAEASNDQEELLVVPVPERDGVDERVDYLRYVHTPPPVRREELPAHPHER